MEDRITWNAVDYVENVNIIDPVHKKTSPDSPIVVCYNRTSQSGERIDYDEYEEAFDPVTHRQWLFGCGSGCAAFKERRFLFRN